MRFPRRAPISQTPGTAIGRFNGSVFVVLVVAAIVTPFLGPDVAAVVATTVMLAGAVTAGTTLFRRSSQAPVEERLAWRLLGSSMLAIGGGLVVFVIAYLQSYAAAFGPPDLLFLMGYLLGMAGIALLPHTTGSGLQRLRLLLDGIIGAVALIAMAWVFFYRQVAEALTESPAWERIVGTAYPIFDIMMLVVLMIVLVRRSSYRYDLRLTLLVVGSVSLAAADMVFLVTGAGKSFIDAQPVYPLHIVGIAAYVGLAAIVDRQPGAREYADRPSTPIWAMALPYGTAIAMVGVLLYRVQWGSISTTDTTLHIATVVVGVLVMIRQSVSIRENRRFVGNQRTDLVASISHELRTPLTAMVGFLELLDSDALRDESERREVTSIVNQQGAYMTRIVSDLVMLASDSIASMELQIAPTAVDQLAWSAVNAAAIDPGCVRVDATDGAIAYLDDGRMQQAIANLLGNALRYGGEKVYIVATASGGELQLEVHDDGPGIPRKYELMIWEKFERGPNRLNATVPGSGIGLAVTNAIAKAHGGTAGYRQSERLGGACFWICLPGRVRDTNPVIGEPAAQLRVVAGDAKTA